MGVFGEGCALARRGGFVGTWVVGAYSVEFVLSARTESVLTVIFLLLFGGFCIRHLPILGSGTGFGKRVQRFARLWCII